MSEISVSDDVKELVDEVIKKNEWQPVTDVKYFTETVAGDGLQSKQVSVDVLSEDKTYRLFVKYALNLPSTEMSQMPQMAQMMAAYANETFFYNVVYPTFLKFLKEKNQNFPNIPKCLGTSKNVIALENVKERGFTLFNRKNIMNDEHIILVLKTFAKFHAISFAFKDQQKEEFDKLSEGLHLEFLKSGMDGPIAFMLRFMFNDTLSKLDPEADKHILEKCNVDELLACIVDPKYGYDDSILVQGDCWCNNLMFLYEKENKECPVDVIILDWQQFRPAPPVYDISYFLYTIASEESLSKLDFHLKVYHDELRDQIKILGSDPDELYPFSEFEKQWKEHCKFGFGSAFAICRLMLMNTDEVPNMEEIDFQNMKDLNPMEMFSKFADESEYIRKIRLLGDFMVKHDYL